MVDGESLVSISWEGLFLLRVDVYNLHNGKFVRYGLCND